MTIIQRGQVLRLSGSVGVEEAEELYSRLRAMSAPRLNLSDCEYMHAAILQLILGLNIKIKNYPKDVKLANILLNSYTLRNSGN